MSKSYIAKASEAMPQAEIIFDRFHIASKMNEAVDSIRRSDVNMLKRHCYGIKAYFKQVASNAFAERVNLKSQEIKRTAKGYRIIQNFMTMIYFHLGGLDLKTHYK